MSATGDWSEPSDSVIPGSEAVFCGRSASDSGDEEGDIADEAVFFRLQNKTRTEDVRGRGVTVEIVTNGDPVGAET